MAPREIFDSTVHSRTITAEILLSGRLDLASFFNAYPHRYLAVSCQTNLGPDRVSYAITAAEILDRYGWDLVSLSEFTAGRVVYALLRRR